MPRTSFYCIHKECITNNQSAKDKVQLFTIPCNYSLRRKWLENLNRLDLMHLTTQKLTNLGYRVCRLHFNSTQFRNTTHSRLKLNYKEVPEDVRKVPQNTQDVNENKNADARDTSIVKITNNQDVRESNSSSGHNEYKWSANITKLLMDLYGKYINKADRIQNNTLKEMWQKIAQDLSSALNCNISANNCENRWRLIDQSYKRNVYNNNSIGRKSDLFEFFEEFQYNYEKKKKAKPQILLNSETIQVSEVDIREYKHLEIEVDTVEPVDNLSKCKEIAKTSKKENKTATRRRLIMKKLRILEKIRQDRLAFQRQKLKYEKKKLQQIIRRNNLIAERNKILKEKKCCCSNL